MNTSDTSSGGQNERKRRQMLVQVTQAAEHIEENEEVRAI